MLALQNVPEETARLAIATGQVFKDAFEEGGLDKWLMDEKVAPFYKMMAEDILKYAHQHFLLQSSKVKGNTSHFTQSMIRTL